VLYVRGATFPSALPIESIGFLLGDAAAPVP
jgi:hypothetical protein